MTEKKKGFFEKMVEKIDKKVEEKSKEKKKGCCGEDNSCCS